MTAPLFLYGAEPSLYTGKTRSYLRKKGIAFQERNASHPRYREVAGIVGRNIIPIIETPDGDIIQDTSEIFDVLEARYPENAMLPDSPRQKLVSYILELFGDEGMLKPAMHYRWNFPDDNFPYIFREFGRATAPQAPMDEAAETSKKFASRMQSYLPMLGVTPETIPLIENAYMELLGLLNDHFRFHPYILGGRPTLGDFGMIAPLYAHLGRDVHPASLMKKRAPFVARWVERMNVADDGMAEFGDLPREILADDEIPETLIPVLKLISQDYFPEIVSVVNAVSQKVRDDNVPAGAPVIDADRTNFGAIEVPYRGIKIQIGVRHFSQWMFQRGLKVYQDLTGEDKTSVDALLEDIGALEAYQISPERWMKRENYKENFV